MKRSVFDNKFQEESVESKIVVALERISEGFRVLLWEESKEHALSPIQTQILIFCLFHDSDKSTVSHLANEFNMTKSTISDSVKSLLSKKLIIKETESDDNRSYSIKLTDSGKLLAKKVSLFANKILEPLANSTNAQNELLLSSLLDLISNLQNTGVISINRMCLSCRFHEVIKKQNYCRLLNAPLKKSELRIDCRDHELINT